MKSNLALSRRLVAACLCFAWLGLVSCDTAPKVPPVSREARQFYRTNIDEHKFQFNSRHVVIEGADIQLPVSSGKLDPQEHRTYSFYIWGDHPDLSGGKSLEELRKEGVFSVEVLGVQAEISVPNYSPKSAPAAPGNGVTKEMSSRGALEVRVRSQDLSRPFSIIAWFPKEYLKEAERNPAKNRVSNSNPWGDRRDVKVYNGDLRTRIDIVDEKEARASFGERFAKFFYVGRIYLRNRSQDKRLVVYTTSMRANVLVYRPPQTNSSLTQKPLTTNQIQFLKDRDTARWKTLQQRPNQQEIDMILSRGRTELENVKDKDPTNRRALAGAIVTNVIPNVRFTGDSGMDGRVGIQSSRLAATEILLRLWDEIPKQIALWVLTAKDLHADADRLESQLPSKIPAYGLKPDLTQLNSQLSKRQDWIRKNTNSEQQREDRLDTLKRQYEKRQEAYQLEAMADALQNNDPGRLAKIPPSALGNTNAEMLVKRYDKNLNDLYARASAGSGNDTPFSQPVDIMVNPADRAMAFSEDTDRQADMAKYGYLWRDSYRPMTFQAVLNALMHSYEKDPKTKTIEVMQSMAALAGGMVGLGSFISELGSSQFAQSVTVFSTIFVPQVARLVLEDLNKHIRNLGEMGLDTVVIIPPNDVVDRYVFFPKGPIYNFRDEFNVGSAVYLQNIDNDDVSIEATLIDAGVVVRGGALDAGSLVDRALNEGVAQGNAELLKQADLKDRLRRMELASMASRIEDILRNAPLPGTNETKSEIRIRAEEQVCREVNSFQSRYGADTTGVLPGLLSKYSVPCDNTPPLVDAGAVVPMHLLPGLVSKAVALPVFDSRGEIWNLKIRQTSRNPDRLPETNVFVHPVPEGEKGRISVAMRAPWESALSEDFQTRVDFTVSNRLALTATLSVPVTIHAPDIQLKSWSNVKNTNSVYKIEDSKQIVEFQLSLPLHDSAAGQIVKFKVSPTNYHQWHFILHDEVVDADINGRAVLQGKLRIDASVATNNSVPLKIEATVDSDTVFAKKELQIVK